MTEDEKRSGLTKAEMILVSMCRASAGGKGRIPYEEIVVHAWSEFPEAYSLRNYPQYPDASDIHKRIYSNLKPNGYAVSLRDKVFRLTDAGIAEAERLIARLGGTPATDEESVVRLSRDEQVFLGHARRSRALELWRNGQGEKLIDFDAQLFFRFGTGTDRAERIRRVQFAQATLEKAHSIHIKDTDDLTELAEFLSMSFVSLWEGES